MKIIDNPKVTLILVAKNEIDYVKAAVNSLLAQGYSKSLTEFIFVDSGSIDGTREFLLGKKEELLRNKLKAGFYDNPAKILASGWNIAIQHSSGDIVCRIDAHSEIASDYVGIGVQQLLTKYSEKYVCIGGTIIENVGMTRCGQIAADLFSSRFGVGNSPFRTGGRLSRETDTAVFGLYWKELFNKIGYFDETLKRNQDMDFHHRVHRNGYKLLTNPDMKIRYYVRNNLCSLIRKAFTDGYWVLLSQKSSLRHKVPMFFIIYLLCLPFFIAISQLVLVPAIIYILLSIGFSIADGKNITSKILLPVFFAIYHISYGGGSLLGSLRRQNIYQQCRKQIAALKGE